MTLQSKSQSQTQREVGELPTWAIAVRPEWERLIDSGAIDADSYSRFTEQMEILSSPLGIDTLWTLERLVLKGFGGAEYAPLTRWESKVRFALHQAILPNATAQNIEEIETNLGVCNPSMLADTREPAFSSKATEILSGISRRSLKDVSGYGDELFLHYFEMFELDGRTRQIEITAVLTSQFDGHQVNLPSDSATFSSIETVDQTTTGAHDTCYRVSPEMCFLGTFTPAYPQPAFAKLAGAADSDFSRVNWKLGRSSMMSRYGHPTNEGCMLTIRRNALRLRPGWGIGWVIHMDGQPTLLLRQPIATR